MCTCIGSNLGLKFGHRTPLTSKISVTWIDLLYIRSSCRTVYVGQVSFYKIFLWQFHVLLEDRRTALHALGQNLAL